MLGYQPLQASAKSIWISLFVIQLRNFSSAMAKRLSPNDPSSFSNPEIVRVDHMHINWTVDFPRKVIGGKVTYRLIPIVQPANEIVFDTRLLNIKNVTGPNNIALPFKLGESLLSFGQPLTIDLQGLLKNSKGPVEIAVEYETSPESSALQWLESEQTAGKGHPYLFSQCEMIHARSLLPSQDTPFNKCPYSAEVTVPKALQALMSAEVSNEIVETSDKKTNKFVQKIPIPSYLIAIAVGHIKGKKIGPRTTVWAEPELLEASAYEFAETEKMLSAAEELMGKYVWGVYDILVLPPSFPMGGMENPNLTFATPTLLAGDRSLSNVIAHEIAHSWTGNLVTNKNFEQFWLNEGFTVFAERKIMGALRGEPFRHFECIGGWKTLNDVIKQLKPDNPITKLVTDLTGLDPDEHFSSVPYEKGSVFLFYLEQTVGGAAVFEPFFKHYIQTNAFKSIDTDVFKNMFINYFTNLGMSDAIASIDWDAWLFTPGMPVMKPNFDTSLSDVCNELKNRWMNWNTTEPCPFSKDDLGNFLSDQIIEFLAELLDEKETPGLSQVQAMQTAYNFNSYKNCEIRYRWLRLCLKAKWKDQVPLVLKFVTEQGRMKYVRPLYQEMYEWEEIRPQAIEHFKKTRSSMMGITATLIAKVLHL